MNIIVSPQSHPTLPPLFEPLSSTFRLGNSLRAHRHPRRATEATPALSRESPAGTRPGADETRAIRKETHCGHQEERKGWPAGQLSINQLRFAVADVGIRTRAKSWLRISSGHDVTSKSSTRCERSFRRLVYVYKLCGRTNKWRRPCAEPLG